VLQQMQTKMMKRKINRIILCAHIKSGYAFISMQFSVSYRQIVKLAAPISISLLIPQLSFLANAAFLGRVGQMELVVSGIASIFYLLLTWLGFGLSNGVLVLLSRRVGERDPDGIARTFNNGLLLCVCAAFIFLFIGLFVAPIVFRHTLSSPDVIAHTISYIKLRVCGLPLLMLTQFFTVFYIATGRSKWLIVGAIAANGVNILFDYLLIFGNGGFPALGLQGAALASILGELAGCLTALGYFAGRKLYAQYPFLRHLGVDRYIVGNIVKVATPLIVQYIFSIGGWQIFYIYIEHLGKTELAASHILRSVFGIMSIGTWALASTANTMVGNIIGQGKRRVVLLLVRKIMLVSFIYASIIAVLLVLFPTVFFKAYTTDAAVIAMGMPSLYVIAVSSLVMSIATVCFNAVVGTGNTYVNLGIEIFCVLMYVAFITVVVEHLRAPLHYAWASEFVYWMALLITAGGYLLSGRWKRKVL
jgi:MATE family multidrug resistance protein